MGLFRSVLCILAVLVSIAVLQACTSISLGGGPNTVPDGCIQVGTNASDGGLAWNAAGTELYVLTVGNPFGSTAGTSNVEQVDWPAKTQSLEFTLPADELIDPTFGDDGTVYWAEPTGIWARKPGDSAHELIGLDGNNLVDLRWTSDGLLAMVQASGGAAVFSVPLAGGNETVVLSDDAAAFHVWASHDGSSIAIIRRPTGEPLQVDLHRDGRTTTTILATNSSVLEWAVKDASALIVLDPTRGLVRQELGATDSGMLIAPSLPKDFWAVSQPTVGGRIAYTGRDTSASIECFSDAIPAADLP
jgi:hypothetical protein